MTTRIHNGVKMIKEDVKGNWLPADYFERERERTIARLRDLDRLLGRRQTIPERKR